MIAGPFFCFLDLEPADLGLAIFGSLAGLQAGEVDNGVDDGEMLAIMEELLLRGVLPVDEAPESDVGPEVVRNWEESGIGDGLRRESASYEDRGEGELFPWFLGKHLERKYIGPVGRGLARVSLPDAEMGLGVG